MTEIIENGAPTEAMKFPRIYLGFDTTDTKTWELWCVGFHGTMDGIVFRKIPSLLEAMQLLQDFLSKEQAYTKDDVRRNRK